MQANLEEVQNLVNRLTFIDKLRLLEYLAPLIARSASAVEAPSQSDDELPEVITSPTYSIHPKRKAMKSEIDAYHRMHSELVSTYLGKYVAVFRGQVVDHDSDPVTLHKRIKAQFPNEIVLSRKVATYPERIVHMRSPRLERSS